MSTGLAGTCAQQKKPILVTDISLSDIYNQRVDIYTLLPAMAYPLIEPKEDGHDKVKAVLEIAMKERNKNRLIDKVEILNKIEEKNDTSQYLIKLYTEMVMKALETVEKRIGEHDIDRFTKHYLDDELKANTIKNKFIENDKHLLKG